MSQTRPGRLEYNIARATVGGTFAVAAAALGDVVVQGLDSGGNYDAIQNSVRLKSESQHLGAVALIAKQSKDPDAGVAYRFINRKQRAVDEKITKTNAEIHNKTIIDISTVEAALVAGLGIAGAIIGVKVFNELGYRGLLKPRYSGRANRAKA